MCMYFLHFRRQKRFLFISTSFFKIFVMQVTTKMNFLNYINLVCTKNSTAIKFSYIFIGSWMLLTFRSIHMGQFWFHLYHCFTNTFPANCTLIKLSVYFTNCFKSQGHETKFDNKNKECRTHIPKRNNNGFVPEQIYFRSTK